MTGENGEEALEFVRLPDNEKFVFLYTELRWLGKTMKDILEGQKRLMWIGVGGVVTIIGAVLSYHIWPR